MLRLMGKVQEPEPFFTPRVDCTRPCQLCAKLFNEDLYGRLKSSDQGLVEVKSSCELLATDLYHSMLGGCKLCGMIGNSVLTATKYGIPLHDERSFTRHIPWYQRQEKATTTPVLSEPSHNKHDQSHKGTAYEYFAGFSQKPDDQSGPSVQSPEGVDYESLLAFQSLDCAAGITLKMTVIKCFYSTGFDLINIDIEAVPTEECPKPWIFIPPLLATLWLEVISDAGQVFSREWKTLSAAGEEWPRVVRGWLDDCRQNHQCAVSSTFRPTRLIDVRDALCPRLIEPAAHMDDELDTPEETHSYVTLSYVWGTMQKYVLTRDTLPAKREGLDTQRLPQAVAEAMEVTRKLGFRYIWIDALCIIQDSPEDKLKELPMMAKIYQYSAMTISAASSPSATEGFLKPPTPPVFRVQPFQVTIGTGEPQFPHMNLSLGFREEQTDLHDPIDSRGWTLQEWALSSCRLRFSSRGIQWTCNKLVADPGALSGEEHRQPPVQFSPAGYEQHYYGEASAIVSSPPELLHRYAVDAAHKRRELASTWIEVRSRYAERSLSFPADKLAAISAVAATAAEENNMTYRAGLWKENLLTDLQWYYIFRASPTGRLAAVTAAAREEEHGAGYLAPSWSWAAVRYDKGVLYPRSSRKWASDSPWHFRILDCAVELADGSEFVFGPVKSGRLDVEGRVLDVEWEPWTENTVALNKLALYDSPRRASGEKLGQAFLDFPTPCLGKGLELKCLILTKSSFVYNRTEPYRSSGSICAWGLLLLPLREPKTYRRVGLCWLFEGGLWHESALESIRII
ncbi:HET-domain-containing protein [Biscogniauxia mediterranea]|nr:HET-domain-containing protein [Biscogniauxia mediterranea]